MDGVDLKAFEFALGKIENGLVFEDFTKNFLSKILSYEFEPVGGIKDRGIDGLEHVFSRKGSERYIYQISIEKACEAKLNGTVNKLINNKINFTQLYFVTNQIFPNIDKVIDQLYDTYHKNVHIYDLKWLSTHVNDSTATLGVYHSFIESHLHEFSRPGKSYDVSNLTEDPRLFVFLRQQWDENRNDLDIDKILVDTLILYTLEGTDPDKDIFRTAEQIKEEIAKLVKFDPKKIYPTIDERLVELSKKPRKIKLHIKAKGYCLPYETRLEIHQKNLNDLLLYESFQKSVHDGLRTHLNDAGIKVMDIASLMETTINRLFYQQGLEFADFVLHGENQRALEKELPDVISYVVDQSPVVVKNKEEVKSALLTTIRDIVYNGSKDQKIFLQRLSNTYMMLFLLQCDPKLASFFGSMASKLTIYVCTSIIIPALSESYLDPIHKRHANLLTGARNAGVNLIVNETIINELVSHFKMIVKNYEDKYMNREDLYLGDEMMTLYIDEIMIRAYFYAKARNRVSNFNDFIEHFINPDLNHADTDIIEWIKEEFGIKYRTNKSLGISINQEDCKLLYDALKEKKKSDYQALTDTNLILAIYALREVNNETGDGGIFGYKTWWLSKDTLTQKTVNKVFQDKYKVSCYIRPDFLYNYISFAPTKVQVDAAYQNLFPSLVGVNIGYHLPSEVTDYIHRWIAEHGSRNPARIKAILRDLSDKLKTDPSIRTRGAVQHYLDELLANEVVSLQNKKH